MSVSTMPAKSRSEKKTQSKSQKSRIPDSLETFFGPEGPLAQALPGYEMRSEQLQVALAVEQAMLEGKPCMAEAGTGVGKTLAYLIPAVRAALDGKRTVISTHTISLQTQLLEKDLPLVLELFQEAGARVPYALMKGRRNYLCKMAMENARNDLLLVGDPDFVKVQRWAARADCTGDVADLPFKFDSWHEVTSTPETCPGQQCRWHNSCFYYRMRFEAAESSILVVNHALFFSDLAMRLADPNSGVLPAYDHVVFDEAHHLEDVATKTFGIEFGSRRLALLMDRIRHIRGLDIEKGRLQTLEDLGLGIFAPFLQAEKNEFYFDDVLKEEETVGKVKEWASQTCNSIGELQRDLMETARDDEPLRERLEGVAKLCGKAREELNALFFQKDDNAIRWGERMQLTRGGRSEPRVTLHSTPLSVARILKEALWNRMQARRGSVTLISATLANSGGFGYLQSRLGVPEDAIACLVGSPFDYKRQAMLYVPGHLPAPAPVPAYTERVVEEIERVLRLSNGRAFLLFTSRAMLNSVHEKLQARNLPFPLFKQGELPPGKLVEAFKASENGCLLGAQTFWEGVDVQGDSLSCVIIDRLPFAVPDSPVTKARTEAIIAAGGDWFREFAIPQAQIRLKQGFGRLVRTRSDRGIVCILDTRLITKDYGAEFVQYLPPASRASKWARVEKFWKGELHTPTPAAAVEPTE